MQIQSNDKIKSRFIKSYFILRNRLIYFKQKHGPFVFQFYAVNGSRIHHLLCFCQVGLHLISVPFLLQKVHFETFYLLIKFLTVFPLNIDIIFSVINVFSQSFQVLFESCNLLGVQVYLFVQSFRFGVCIIVAGPGVINLVPIFFAVVFCIIQQLLFMHNFLL